MQRLIQHLLRLVGNEKLLRKWENVSTGQAYRSLFMSLATLLSATVGISVQSLTSNYALSALAATASLPILLPLSIILVDRLQRRALNLVVRPELINERVFLEYKYDQAIRQIESLGLPKNKEDTLKIEQFKELQKQLNAIDAKRLN